MIKSSHKYGILGAIVGVAIALTDSPITVADIVIIGVILGVVGFVIGKYQENSTKS